MDKIDNCAKVEGIKTVSQKISVIMPVYNCEAYLEKALQSVLAQSVEDLEIIAVEDCSTDHSRELLCRLAQGEPRIRVLLNEHNMGVSATRNRALEVAEGDYITFCDSDDTVPQNAYAALLAAIGDKDVAMGGFEDLYYEKDTVARSEMQRIDPRAKESAFFALYSVWTVCSKLFKASFLREKQMRFREDMRVGEDAIFLAQLASHAPTYAMIEQSVYQYHHYQSENYRSLTHVYDLDIFRQHVECRYEIMRICRDVPECRDYVYQTSTGYIERRMHLLPYGEARQRGFDIFREYVKGYDFENRPLFFKAITGVEYETFLQVDADRYFELQDEMEPRERVAAQFDCGMIGLRWIVRYFKGWLKFKIQRNSK